MHSQIPQINVVFKTQRPGHLRAHLHQLLEQILQLRFILLKPAPVSQSGFLPDCRILVVHGLFQLCQGPDPVLKGNLGRGNQVLIGGGQRCFLLQMTDDGRAEAPSVHLRCQKPGFRQLFLQLRGKGTLQDRIGDGLECFFQQRHRFVKPGVLLPVKRIFRVQGMPDGGQFCHGQHVGFQVVILMHGLQEGIIRRRCLQRRPETGKLRLQGLQIRA